MRINGHTSSRQGQITFEFDGSKIHGFSGDTVASALLANDIRLVGRSFKYHRPRGILTAGSEEPNALITVGQGANQDPNIRATQQEIYDGLVTRSQNRWPSLQYDVLSINDLAAPFLGAGFYYKTFMWPEKFWEKIYEPLIRNAAGLGALSMQANTDKYDKAFAFCDVLIVGAGPAGIMAAWVLAQAGLDVILADEDFKLGGRLNAETYEIDGMRGADWAKMMVDRLSEMENVRLMPRTTVTGAYDQGTFGALERVGHHHPRKTDGRPLECFWRIVAKRTILAAGALERMIAFANNDRPGIMMASAVRGYVNRFGVVGGQSVSIFGNNDDAFRTAQDLQAAGVTISAYVDTRHDATIQGDFPIFKGAEVFQTTGRLGLKSIKIRHSGGIDHIATDILGVSGGWNPTVHLSCHMNGRPQWRDDIASFVPVDGAIPTMVAAGAVMGHFSTQACLQSGFDVAQSVAMDLGAKRTELSVPQSQDTPFNITPHWSVAGKGRAWLDFQNDVTVKDVRQSAQENFRSVEHMKRYTTQGMATDQGKNSNVAALAILADVTGRAIPETGTTTFRPPFVPVSIAAMGQVGQGKGFAPERFITSHEASKSRGAPFIEAGLWYRPSYFPQQGETTWRQSCDREVAMVRNAVGVCDVSTLGKIDIQGPDAAKLLDFVYTNRFSTLKQGRVRYGLMLREDGYVMDDGTTARIGDNHYIMTTTTAAAGLVMRHLDFVLQCLRPDWDVKIQSVTEHWAQFAITGPHAREVLAEILNDPIDNDTWPFMSCGSVKIGHVDARLFRISFSGELGFELAIPARFGESLFNILCEVSAKFGGGPYGIEALNVLRIEKGFLTHAEIHGRTTAFDVGLGKMVSVAKDCIGKTMAARPGLMDPNRERLVGLKPIGAVQQLLAGAHLFHPDDDAISVNDQGYITSACYSPTLGHSLALAFLKNGPERIGQQVKMVDHMRGVQTLCEVIDPVAYDPTGGRLRG